MIQQKTCFVGVFVSVPFGDDDEEQEIGSAHGRKKPVESINTATVDVVDDPTLMAVATACADNCAY